MKKSLITLTTVMLLSTSLSMTSWAMTADEVTAKNPISYTAGTNSIYGSALSQEQLNAVAQATADFMTANITDSMSTDDKIKTAYNYIKDRTTYVNWDAVTGANTAYTLVTGQGACSGMCRSMKALCDAMGIECYHVHSTSNDHQWNLVRYGDGILYHVDIDANKSAGQDIIYKSLTHPLPYDTSAYPAVGQVQEQTANNGWQQENGKWYYYENGSKATNKWINGTYYVGSYGAMLTNTTTPDGYQVGADGAWIQTQATNDGVHTYRASDYNSVLNFWLDEDGLPRYQTEYRNGILCDVMDTRVISFRVKSDGSNVEPSNHTVLIYGARPTSASAAYSENIPFTVIGEPKAYTFKYDTAYSLDFTGNHPTGESLSKYCIENDIIIVVDVIDDLAPIGSEKTGWQVHDIYATPSSVQTGEIG